MDRLQEESDTSSRRLSWIPEFIRMGQVRFQTNARLMGLAILVGLVAGLGAIVFYMATRAAEHFSLGVVAGYEATPHPAGEVTIDGLPDVNATFRPWMLLIIPTIGGLLSGILVYTLAPEAEGHGTDAVIEAYHHHQGEIRPRVPLVKIIASALTLGTGGSGGREGPIAQIGAGFGSLLSNMLHLRPAERRILMAAGMGAGIAAIFRAPLAGALFASEVLYSSPEFEPEVIMPAAIACVVSYCTFGMYAGWAPLFSMPELAFSSPLQLGPYLLLVIFMVLLAMLYTRTFYGCVGAFRRLPMPPHFRPAVGAFLTGAVALGLYYAFGGEKQMLSVLAFGYSAVQGAISSDTGSTATILLAIALGKILTTSLTIGSGGSGGVFGPSMVIGGCAGGALGLLLHGWWPWLVPHPASFVIVGMAGFFAAAAKTPFSTLIIVSEMTGGYHLLLPALWVCALAFMLSDKQSIYSAQVESRSRSPAHRGTYVRQVLSGVRVNQFLKTNSPPLTLHPNDTLSAVLDRLKSATCSVLPVVDDDERLLGVVNLEEVHLAAQAAHMRSLILAADLMRSDIVPLQPGDQLDRAMELFVENDLFALPVVNDLRRRRLIGMVQRFEIASAYVKHVHGSRSGGEA